MRLLAGLIALCIGGAAQAQAQAQTQGQVPRPGEAPGQAQPRPAPRVSLVDRIVAVVGKEVITLSELAERREFAERQLQRQGTPLPERALLERQILERLIVDKAQMQLARDSGIRVEEIQLDRALERVAEQNKMSLPQFRQALEKDGVAFDRFREEVRQQIQMQRLREREVDDRIEVSDAEIDQALAEAKSGGSARSEYNLAHVLVRLPEQASPEQIDTARKKAEKARAEAAGEAAEPDGAAEPEPSIDHVREGKRGGAAWGAFALVKILVLFGGIWVLLTKGLVDPMALVVGYGVLPLGIAASSLIGSLSPRSRGTRRTPPRRK